MDLHLFFLLHSLKEYVTDQVHFVSHAKWMVVCSPSHYLRIGIKRSFAGNIASAAWSCAAVPVWVKRKQCECWLIPVVFVYHATHISEWHSTTPLSYYTEGEPKMRGNISTHICCFPACPLAVSAAQRRMRSTRA